MLCSNTFHKYGGQASKLVVLLTYHVFIAAGYLFAPRHSRDSISASEQDLIKSSHGQKEEAPLATHVAEISAHPAAASISVGNVIGKYFMGAAALLKWRYLKSPHSSEDPVY